MFDLREERVGIRVVYDGVAGAGKTTNVQRLAGMLAAQQTSAVCSPGELEGRTLYFDWLEVRGGVVDGIPVLCQVLSVPGQAALAARRRHLLATADVVVHVCESTPEGVLAAREALSILEETSAGRPPPPLVVQANKQDERGALTAAELLERIGGRDATCVAAIARDGVGVVDTFLAAIRVAARSLEAQPELLLPIRPIETSGAALAMLSTIEVDRRWAAEMYLDLALRALTRPTD